MNEKFHQVSQKNFFQEIDLSSTKQQSNYKNTSTVIPKYQNTSNTFSQNFWSQEIIRSLAQIEKTIIEIEILLQKAYDC